MTTFEHPRRSAPRSEKHGFLDFWPLEAFQRPVVLVSQPPGRVNRMSLTGIVDSQHHQLARWRSSGTSTAMPGSSPYWAIRISRTACGPGCLSCYEGKLLGHTGDLRTVSDRRR